MYLAIFYFLQTTVNLLLKPKSWPVVVVKAVSIMDSREVYILLKSKCWCDLIFFF